jgi:hypothetical protein
MISAKTLLGGLVVLIAVALITSTYVIFGPIWPSLCICLVIVAASFYLRFRGF